MALFRPYEQGKRDENATPRTASTPRVSDRPAASGATAAGVRSSNETAGSDIPGSNISDNDIRDSEAQAAAASTRRFGRRGGATAVRSSGGATAVTPASSTSTMTAPATTHDAEDDRVQNRGPRVKQGPTPSRKEAERARMERLHPTLTPKEQKAQARANDRVARERRFEAVENSPGRVLVRDYVDARWTIVEFMIPLMILVMALTMAATLVSPRLMYWLTFGMYAVFLAAIINVVILWRGFKRELARRHPGTPTRGLLNYMINRSIWIRRFRRPAPRLNRGDSY